MLFLTALLAFIVGIGISIPMGPGGLAVFQLSKESKAKAFQGLFYFILAETLIGLGILLFQEYLITFIQSAWTKLAAGIFLLVYCLFQIKNFSKSKVPKTANKINSKSSKTSNVFHITFFNPGVWLGMILIFSFIPSFLEATTANLLFYLFFIEIGVVSWFLLAIIYAQKLKPIFFKRIEALIIIGMLIISMFYFYESTMFFMQKL